MIITVAAAVVAVAFKLFISQQFGVGEAARCLDSSAELLFPGKLLPEMGSHVSSLASHPSLLRLLNGGFGSEKFTHIEQKVYQNHDNSVLVLKAHHKMYGVVAVKMVSMRNPDVQRRCKREEYLLQTFSTKRQICHKFDSKIIVRPEFNPVHVLVLEYMEFGTVADLLKKSPCGRLDQFTVTRMGMDVLSGLQFLHKHGIIHRDIKDSNIGVTNGGGGIKCFKILDLGISVANDAGTM